MMPSFLRLGVCRPVCLFALLLGCARDRIAGPSAHPNLVLGLPPNLRPCSSVTAFFVGTPISDRESWYGKQLRAAGEHSLCTDSAGVPETYRLTWIPSFHPTVVVRFEFTTSGARLTGKILSGAGGYDPGLLAKEVVEDLSDADVARFSELVQSAHFWEQPTKRPLLGCDGAQWVLEALSERGYHVVDRWSPQQDGPDAQYRELGDWMLARSGLVPASIVQDY